jgi:hypothetical protein
MIYGLSNLSYVAFVWNVVLGFLNANYFYYFMYDCVYFLCLIIEI